MWAKIPGLGTKILQAAQHGKQTNKKNMIYRPHTFHKYFLKMDNEPKYKTVKHIDDNTGDTDLGLGNDVLDTTPKYNP